MGRLCLWMMRSASSSDSVSYLQSVRSATLSGAFAKFLIVPVFGWKTLMRISAGSGYSWVVTSFVDCRFVCLDSHAWLETAWGWFFAVEWHLVCEWSHQQHLCNSPGWTKSSPNLLGGKVVPCQPFWAVMTRQIEDQLLRHAVSFTSALCVIMTGTAIPIKLSIPLPSRSTVHLWLTHCSFPALSFSLTATWLRSWANFDYLELLGFLESR